MMQLGGGYFALNNLPDKKEAQMTDSTNGLRIRPPSDYEVREMTDTPSSPLQRYTVEFLANVPQVTTTTDGEWVKYADVATLRSEIAPTQDVRAGVLEYLRAAYMTSKSAAEVLDGLEKMLKNATPQGQGKFVEQTSPAAAAPTPSRAELVRVELTEAVNGLPEMWRAGFLDRFERLLSLAIQRKEAAAALSRPVDAEAVRIAKLILESSRDRNLLLLARAYLRAVGEEE